MPCVCWKKEKIKVAKKTIETNNTPKVRVQQVGSDLQVKGWDRAEVLVKSSSDNNVVLEETEGVVNVSSPSDCVLYLPHDASLEILQAGRNVRILSVFGEISIRNIGTALALRDVGFVTAENIGTDFSAKRVNGDLSIENIGSSATIGDVGGINLVSVGSQLVAKRVRGDLKVSGSVGGNAVVRDVDGQVMINSVGGSLHLREVSGGITVDVGGNATVEFSPMSWQAYGVDTGGNIRVHVPSDANATFEILSGARDIRIKTPEISEKLEESNYSLTLGEGAASVKLNAGAAVNITTREMDWEGLEDFEIDFGKEISSMAEEISNQAIRQIETQLEMIENNLNVHISGLGTSLEATGLSEERMRMLEERLEQARARAAERAEMAASRAKQKVELKIAAAQRKAQRKSQAAAARAARKARQSRGEPSFKVMPAPIPLQPADPVSEQERMMILQMLQDKKISVEQAEKLLSALEDKGS
jgi:hypothetical protein